jgi:regulatory protein
MVISSLLYKNERVQVFVDNKYSFSCTTDFVLENRLFKDKEISEEQLDILKNKEVEEALRIRLISYAYSKFSSRRELYDKLNTYSNKKFRKKVSKDDFSKYWKYIEEKGIYDEEKIVKALIKHYQEKKKGNRYIESLLLQKGYSKDIVKDLLKENIGEDPNETIKELIEKKLGKGDKSDMKLKARVYRYVLSRGFDYEDISKVWKSINL